MYQKPLGKKSTSLHDKNSEETMSRRIVPQHKRGHTEQIYIQQCTKWRKNTIISSKNQK
jgi:hypothetical protein